ncbi:MAG: UDP-glucose--hexose-1-phosphate uridylyltransferase [Chitinophagaceae bacterium]
MLPIFDLNEHVHERLNVLTGEWLLVSPHRNKRPWQGKVEAPAVLKRPDFMADCYLCPGNTRADGSTNPLYTEAFSFTNDFAALRNDTPPGEMNEKQLLVAKSQSGTCKVICFTPRHDLTLPQMEAEDILAVVNTWCDEFRQLAEDPVIKYIQIFENKGEIMGCSNPHPHGQIWAQNDLPMEIQKETRQQKQYFETNGRSLLADYLQLEIVKRERLVCENEHFVALVPFWATWPYEILVISRRHVPTLLQFDEKERSAYADILKRLTTRYDNLFQTSFPYSAGIHQAPVNDGDHQEWHWHMHFYPPLLRSATVKKFMVGYEMLANPQRDITAEIAAKQLQEMSEVHFMSRNA